MSKFAIVGVLGMLAIAMIGAGAGVVEYNIGFANSMRAFLSVALLAASLFVALASRFAEADKKMAYGTIGALTDIGSTARLHKERKESAGQGSDCRQAFRPLNDPQPHPRGETAPRGRLVDGSMCVAPNSDIHKQKPRRILAGALFDPDGLRQRD